MSQRKCEECGHPTSNRAVKCPICGNSFRRKKTRVSRSNGLARSSSKAKKASKPLKSRSNRHVDSRTAQDSKKTGNESESEMPWPVVLGGTLLLCLTWFPKFRAKAWLLAKVFWRVIGIDAVSSRTDLDCNSGIQKGIDANLQRTLTSPWTLLGLVILAAVFVGTGCREKRGTDAPGESKSQERQTVSGKQADPKKAAMWCDQGWFKIRANGQVDEGLQCFEAALACDPAYGPAWCAKGRVLTMRNKYRQAMPLLEKATELSPSLAEAWAWLSYAKIQTGHYSEALHSAEKALALYAASPPRPESSGIVTGVSSQLKKVPSAHTSAPSAFALSCKGQALVKLERISEGLSCLDKSLEGYAELLDTSKGSSFSITVNGLEYWVKPYHSERSEALLAKAEALQYQHRHGEAADCIEQALDANPALFRTWDRYGIGRMKDVVVLADNGREYEASVVLFKRNGIAFRLKHRAASPLGRKPHGMMKVMASDGKVVYPPANNSPALFWQCVDLISKLHSQEHSVQAEAAGGLVRLGKSAVPLLIEQLDVVKDDVLKSIVDCLCEIGGDLAVDALVSRLDKMGPLARHAFIRHAWKFDQKIVIDTLVNAFDDPDARIYWAAVDSLSQVNSDLCVERLLKGLSSSNGNVVMGCVRSLVEKDNRRAVQPIIKLIQHDLPQVRLAAAEALGDLDSREALQILAEAKEDTDPDVRAAAIESVEMIQAKGEEELNLRAKRSLTRRYVAIIGEGIALGPLFQFFHKWCKVNVLIDWPALGRVGLKPETLVDLRIPTMSPGAALKELLATISPEGTLSYKFFDEGIIVSTTEGLEKQWPYRITSKRVNISKGLELALKKRCPRLEFSDLEIGEIVYYLKQLTGRAILVDWRELDKAGIHKDTTISLDLNNVSVSMALRYTLAATNPREPVGYRLEEHTIRLSTIKDLQEDYAWELKTENDTHIDAPTARSLNMKLDSVEFVETELREALLFLLGQDEAPIGHFINWSALAAAGLRPETKVSVSELKNCSVRTALHEVLRSRRRKESSSVYAVEWDSLYIHQTEPV